MMFWQLWEVAFQAFMIIIGVGIIWMRFIEPYLPSQQSSVILMIIVAIGLAVLRIALGVRNLRQGERALRAKIEGLNGPVKEAQ